MSYVDHPVMCMLNNFIDTGYVESKNGRCVNDGIEFRVLIGPPDLSHQFYHGHGSTLELAQEIYVPGEVSSRAFEINHHIVSELVSILDEGQLPLPQREIHRNISLPNGVITSRYNSGYQRYYLRLGFQDIHDLPSKDVADVLEVLAEAKNYEPSNDSQ